MQRCLEATFSLGVLAYLMGFSMLVVATMKYKNSEPWDQFLLDNANRYIALVILHGCFAGEFFVAFICRSCCDCDADSKQSLNCATLFIAMMAFILETIVIATSDFTEGVRNIVTSALCMGGVLLLFMEGFVQWRLYDPQNDSRTDEQNPPQRLDEETPVSRTKTQASNYGSMGQTASSDAPIPSANEASSGADPSGTMPVPLVADCQQHEHLTEDGAREHLKPGQDLLAPQQGQCGVAIVQEGAKEGKE